MPYTSGSVTAFSGASGLLQAVINFVTGAPGTPGRDWTVLLNQNSKDTANPPLEPFGSDCKEVILKNTGISGTETVIVGIREWKYPGANAWGWDLNGYISWQSGNIWNVSGNDHGLISYDGTWEHFTYHPTVPLADDNMSYWIYSNKQRIIIVAKVSTHYEMCYLGFGKRFGSSSEYPYPLAIIGSLWGNYSYTYEGGYHHFIVAPAHSSGTNYYGQMAIDPKNSFLIGTHAPIHVPGNDFAETGAALDKTKNGKVLLMPCYLVSNAFNVNETLMELDGVFFCPSINIQAEDLIQDGGNNYKVFNDIYRNDFWNFMAIEEA